MKIEVSITVSTDQESITVNRVHAAAGDNRRFVQSEMGAAVISTVSSLFSEWLPEVPMELIDALAPLVKLTGLADNDPRKGA